MHFNIIIDKKIVLVNRNMTILQACESVNIIVPKFCYHERLSIAGNCRMCLVEIDKAPKLVASCAMPVVQNMVIHTNSLAVKKARENVLEFLLINHPLDCGICDQAGECDLQEQSKGFGSDRGRFQENKRAVQDFDCGPLIKTIMSRCIHCTRCVRFANEIIGLPDLGTSGRGGSLEINLYITKLFKSEFSGNLIDLCPVGALTSKPYTFTARSWELKSIESVDVLDSIGSNIRLDIRGYELMRILPRLNENINEEWISDKTRFAFDGLQQQRLYEPLLKNFNDKFEVITWKQAIHLVIQHLNNINLPYKFGAVVGSQADIDSISLLTYLTNKYNGSFIDFENVNLLDIDFKCSYLFNSNFKNLEKADICLLLGINPRIEGAILNLRLRKRFLGSNFKIASFGSFFDVSFPIYNLGSTLSALLNFIEGRHLFSKYFSIAKQPMVIIGQSFFEIFEEKQMKIILELLIKNTFLLKKKWCGINIFSNKASDSGKYEIGLKTHFPVNLDPTFLYGIGEAKLKRLKSSTFIVYQGYQANSTTHLANMILPGKAFTEKTSIFLNSEGRYQSTKIATSSPTSSKDDWSILYAILEKNNLLSFIKVKKFSYAYAKKNFFDSVTLINKVEMDPFYDLSGSIEPPFADTNFSINNRDLILIAIKSLKDSNFDLYENGMFIEDVLRVLPEMNLSYPEIYKLYIDFIQLMEEASKKPSVYKSFGVSSIAILQFFCFYCYVYEENFNFFELVEKKLDNFEILTEMNIMFREINTLSLISTNEKQYYCFLDMGFVLDDGFCDLFYFSSILLELFSSINVDEFTFFREEITPLFESSKTVLAYLKKHNHFSVIKKFFTFFPEFLRQFHFKNLDEKYFESTNFKEYLNFYIKYLFLKNNFIKRYDKIGLVQFEIRNIPADHKYNIILEYAFFYEYYNEKQYQNLLEQIEISLSFSFYYFDYAFSSNIFSMIELTQWLNLINTKSNKSPKSIKSLFFSTIEHNKSTYQSFIFKAINFSKVFKSIIKLQNKILSSSKFDNFYLTDDFSKFSILMKHYSDVFLERSPFKK